MTEELKYGVSLADHMSGPAHAAADSLAHLAKGAEHGKGLIDELTHGMVRAVEPAEVLKGAFEGVGAGLKSFASGVASGEVKEVIAGVTESMAGLAQMLDLLVPGLGQAAAAIIKLSGGIVGAFAGIVQEGAAMAIEATQAKAALIDTFAALGGGLSVGRETEEMLAGLSHQLGVTKETLAPLAKHFMAMGIEGEEALKKVTLAAISAQAIMQDPGAAAAFETLTKKIQVAAQTGHGLKIPEKGLKSLADMGIRVDDVAQRMGVSSKALAAELKAGTIEATKFGEALQDALIAKGAGPLDRMGKSFANLKKMFGQSIEEMFEDMGKSVEPFLDQVKEILHLFEQSTESGKVMKDALGGVFSFVFGEAASGTKVLRHALEDVIIASLEVAIVVKHHWKEISLAFAAARPELELVAKAFAQMGKAADSLYRLDAAINGLAHPLGTLATKSGRSFSDGLADGIAQGKPKVIAAAQDVAKAADGGVTEKLQVKSPSLVAMRAGGHFGTGLSLGIRQSAPQVRAASTRLASVSLGGVTGAMRQTPAIGASVGARQISPTIRDTSGPREREAPRAPAAAAPHGPVTIHITAPNGVTSALELTEIAVSALFERYAIQQGAA